MRPRLSPMPTSSDSPLPDFPTNHHCQDPQSGIQQLRHFRLRSQDPKSAGVSGRVIRVMIHPTAPDSVSAPRLLLNRLCRRVRTIREARILPASMSWRLERTRRSAYQAPAGYGQAGENQRNVGLCDELWNCQGPCEAPVNHGPHMGLGNSIAHCRGQHSAGFRLLGRNPLELGKLKGAVRSRRQDIDAGRMRA